MENLSNSEIGRENNFFSILPYKSPRIKREGVSNIKISSFPTGNKK